MKSHAQVEERVRAGTSGLADRYPTIGKGYAGLTSDESDQASEGLRRSRRAAARSRQNPRTSWTNHCSSSTSTASSRCSASPPERRPAGRLGNVDGMAHLLSADGRRAPARAVRALRARLVQRLGGEGQRAPAARARAPRPAPVPELRRPPTTARALEARGHRRARRRPAAGLGRRRARRRLPRLGGRARPRRRCSSPPTRRRGSRTRTSRG